jgi:hypothetical protein
LSDDSASPSLVRRQRELERQPVDRAKAGGSIRDDLSGVDLTVAFLSVCGILDATRGTRIDTWSRRLSFVLQGFAAGGAAPDAFGYDALYREKGSETSD